MVVLIVLGAGIFGFVFGAIIGGTISWKDGYDKGVEAVYRYYRNRGK